MGVNPDAVSRLGKLYGGRFPSSPSSRSQKINYFNRLLGGITHHDKSHTSADSSFSSPSSGYDTWQYWYSYIGISYWPDFISSKCEPQTPRPDASEYRQCDFRLAGCFCFEVCIFSLPDLWSSYSESRRRFCQKWHVRHPL